MTSQDYDEIEKTFAGKWILDKDDGNVEAFFKAEELSADLTKMVMHEEHLTISRVGDSIKEINVMEGVEYTFNMKLNEKLDWHDKAENPRFHFNILLSYKDGVLTQEVTPLKANEGKKHYLKMNVKDDTLIMELHFTEQPSIEAKRFFKKS